MYFLPRGLAFTWRKHVRKQFIQYIDQFGAPDIINAHNLLYAGLAGLVLKDEFNIPLILTEHHSRHLQNSFKPWQRGLVYNNIGNIDYGIAVSQRLKAAILEHLEAEEPKWTVVPNMLNNSFIDTPAELNSFESEFRFISVGNLVPIKRHDLILKAFGRVKSESRIPVRLDIVGDGGLRNRLANTVKEYRLQDVVSFKGALDRPELIQTIDRSHVFLSASQHETFGLAICEALARGKPVIATKSGGPEEFITESNGMLIPVDNVSKMTSAMLKMMQTYRNYDQEQIRRQAIARFAPKAIIEQLTTVYKNLLSS